uniref:Uncharacterized protein n=1 Tax=Zooxanthella nutricula TaxID=1333877 RepID=A0A7S2PEG3_9DINO
MPRGQAAAAEGHRAGRRVWSGRSAAAAIAPKVVGQPPDDSMVGSTEASAPGLNSPAADAHPSSAAGVTSWASRLNPHAAVFTMPSEADRSQGGAVAQADHQQCGAAAAAPPRARLNPDACPFELGPNRLFPLASAAGPW